MAILMMLNLKGGVAKTANAVAIAECLATSGYRTLLIDADHQCMASELLLGENSLYKCENRRRTLHDLLAAMLDEEFAPQQFVYYVVPRASNIDGGLEKLSCLPCSVRIDEFSTNMAKARRGHQSNDDFLRTLSRRKQQLRRWLTEQFDFTIIDCPPSLSMQVRFLLSVGDGYIVPSIPDRLSVRGSLYLLERLKSYGFVIKPIGLLWSLYREQAAMHVEIVERAGARKEPLDRLPRPFQTIIPNAAAIAAATEPGQAPTTFRQKYSSAFSQRYERLCREIVQRTQWQADVESVREVSAASR